MVYAAAPAGPGAKQHLAALLWARLHGGSRERGSALGLATSRLGRPVLLVGRRQGPRVSFCHAGGLTWAALANTRGVGIDLAHPQEFAGDYPLARVFSAGEMRRLRRLCPERRQRAALLWSLKEAAAKALGTGFHTTSPLRLRCSAPLVEAGRLRFQISGPAVLRAWAQPRGAGWLALAAL